jgi:hypothetical protein
MIDTVYFEHAGIALTFESYNGNLFRTVAVSIKYNEHPFPDLMTAALVSVIIEDAESPGLNTDYYEGDGVLTIDLNAQLIAYVNDDGVLVSLPTESFVEAFAVGLG